MVNTHLDQIVEYPAKVMNVISQSNECVGLLVNKSFGDVNEDDIDIALDKYITNYEYVDNTVQEACAFIWVEAEVDRVENQQIKDMKLYVTVACHKEFMKLKSSVFKGVIGNRRDNLTRFIDNLLNGAIIMGIGSLKLESVRTRTPINNFTMRELCYSIPDFNKSGSK